jgi:diguanylate cyclase (GGDEF)-like protein
MKDILVEILELCLYLDKKSAEIYMNFSNKAEHEELKGFWRETSLEEHGHAIFWDKLLKLAHKGMLPQIFDSPFGLRDELRSTKSKIDSLVKRSKQVRSISEVFLIAYRVEFYLLHPEFEALFHFIKTILNEPTPGEEYDGHLKRFLVALNKYCAESPELEFLGETILRFRELSNRLALQTHIDYLTGIFNRRGLFDTILPLSFLAKRNNYSIGIMMADIDHFKKVNDTYGHQTGDRILRDVARLIKEGVRNSDIVGRYGGEEFLVFLSPVDPKFLFSIAEKIRSTIDKESRHEIPVTISIGVSYGVIKDDIEKDVEELIKSADECLYRAKKTGRNKVVSS